MRAFPSLAHQPSFAPRPAVASRRLAAVVLASVTIAGLAGCATSQPSDPRASDSQSQEQLQGPATNEPNTEDVHFYGMMTPHHEQAVVMSELVLAADGVSDATRDLATRIKNGQEPEIDLMTASLTEWGRAGDLDVHRTHIMGGMLTPPQMSALESASGPDSERLFLEGMLQHHEGGLVMTQVAIDGGQASRALAQQMMTVQSAEIDEMRAMLDDA